MEYNESEISFICRKDTAVHQKITNKFDINKVSDKKKT